MGWRQPTEGIVEVRSSHQITAMAKFVLRITDRGQKKK